MSAEPRRMRLEHWLDEHNWFRLVEAALILLAYTAALVAYELL